MIYLNRDTLVSVMSGLLLEAGVSGESVTHVVNSMIQTSERGVDSHGIQLFPHYLHAARSGRINRTPHMRFSRSSASVGLLDADHAFGHHAGAVAIDKAVEMAIESGVGAVSVKNSTHFGAAAYFCLRGTDQNFISLAFTNADSLVKAFGGTEAFFGTNPICFTAPMANEGPFCLDMATSQVSWNKILHFRRQKGNIPSHWAFDDSGNPVIDPEKAATLSPIGAYKGFGLGMMIEILCSLLAHGPAARDLLPMYRPPIDESKRRISHFFMALDISRFLDVDDFKRTLQDLVDAVRSMTPIVPGERVMVAGDPEKICFEVRRREGIPVDPVKFSEMLSLSPDFSEAVLR
jgi:LDH2 family malate/lactate/ureidoglycolate dehydrogenase